MELSFLLYVMAMLWVHVALLSHSFQNLINQRLPITDERMTRFMISLQDGVKLVLLALEDMLGGEICSQNPINVNS